MYKRREFLKLSGSIAGSVLLAPLACKLMPKEGDIKDFGLQLYSLRDELPKDVKGILKEVSLAGYKQIESYENKELGMFWGMTNKEFKNYLDSINLVIISSHCDPTNKDFEQKANAAAEIGMKYLIYNWPDKTKPLDEFKKAADDFNKYGEICKKAGIRFANHNYISQFEQMDGQYPMDLLMQGADLSLVDFQMDIYWVVTAKSDPEAWLKKYSNRFRLCHIKDRIRGATGRDASTELGKGSINFSKILTTARDNGMQFYIAEQERYDNSTPLKSIREDAEYLKELKLK